MKRKIALFTILILILGLCACGTKETSDETSNKPSTNQESNESSNEKLETIFEQFENELTAHEYTYEKVTMAAEMIGAKRGIKYKFADDVAAELYEFDESSEAYTNAQKSNSITLEDIGSFEATVKCGYALISDDQTIIDIFESIVK